MRRHSGLPESPLGGKLVLSEALETEEVQVVGFGGAGGDEGDLIAAQGAEGFGVSLLLD